MTRVGTAYDGAPRGEVAAHGSGAAHGGGVAVVTVVAGRHDRLRRQRAALAAGTAVPDVHVVAAMGDPRVADVVRATGPKPVVVEIDVAADGRLPVAAGRNAAATAALAAGADRLVFLDVDVMPGPALVARYVDALTARPDALLSGPVAYLPAGVTDPAQFAAHPFHAARPVPADGDIVEADDPDLFWSLSFGLTAATWHRIGGFDEAYRGYGAEDTDFAARAVRADVPFAWVGGAAGYHLHHPVSSPPVEHLDDILRNGALFRDRWGRWPMRGWLAAFEQRGLIMRTDDGWVRVT